MLTARMLSTGSTEFRSACTQRRGALAGPWRAPFGRSRCSSASSIFVRTSRVRLQKYAELRVTVGSSMARACPSGSSRKGTLPDDGSMRRWSANRRIRRMAIQKFGMAVPNAVSSEMPTSARVPGRTAASVPSTRATSTASRRESRASSRLSGSRAAIAPEHGLARPERASPVAAGSGGPASPRTGRRRAA